MARPFKKINGLSQSENEKARELIAYLKKTKRPVNTEKIATKLNICGGLVRKLVNYIRSNSIIPIVCVGENRKGYEITMSKKKIREQVDSLQKRAELINQSAKGLKKFL